MSSAEERMKSKPASWTAHFVASSVLKSQEEAAGRAIIPPNLIPFLQKFLGYCPKSSFALPQFVDRFIWYMVSS